MFTEDPLKYVLRLIVAALGLVALIVVGFHFRLSALESKPSCECLVEDAAEEQR